MRGMQFLHLTYFVQVYFVMFMYWRSLFTIKALHFPIFIKLILES